MPKAPPKKRRPAPTNAPSRPPPTTHIYTVLLCTPLSSPPTFLSHLSQTDFTPSFIGAGASFLHKEKRTLRNWTNVVVLPQGEGDEWTRATAWKQRWGVTVVAREAFSNEESPEGEVGVDKTTNVEREEQEEEDEDIEPAACDVPRPLTLAMQRLRSSTLSLHPHKQKTPPRLHVLSFIEFKHTNGNDGDEAARTRTRLAQLLASAAKHVPRCGARLHLAGRVASVGRIQTFDGRGGVAAARDAEPADFLSVMSFEDEAAYARYQAWFCGEAAREGVRVHEGVVLTEPLDVRVATKTKGEVAAERRRKRAQKKRGEPKPFVWTNAEGRTVVHPVGGELW